MVVSTAVRSVVLVDDDPDVRFLVGGVLVADGRFEIVGECPDARQGLRAVRRARPDVVLVDLDLGRRRDGVWLIRQLTAAHPDVAVVVVTGHDAGKHHDDALAAGARAVVRKVELSGSLAERIHDVLAVGSPASLRVDGEGV